eukprot:gene22847-29021_t
MEGFTGGSSKTDKTNSNKSDNKDGDEDDEDDPLRFGAPGEENYEVQDEDEFPFACHLCREPFTDPVVTLSQGGGGDAKVVLCGVSTVAKKR